jgi:hypothetical protein
MLTAADGSYSLFNASLGLSGELDNLVVSPRLASGLRRRGELYSGERLIAATRCQKFKDSA